MRLYDAKALPRKNRQHFCGAAATAMRRIQVDRARVANAKKRMPEEQVDGLDEVVELAPSGA